MSLHTPRVRRLAFGLALAALPLLQPTPGAAAATAMPAAEGVVVGVGSADAVPGRYLVLLRPAAAGTVSATSVAGVDVDRTYAGIGAFSARLSPAAARRLAADPAVAMVEQVRRVHIQTYTENRPSWNLDRIDQRPPAPSRTYTPTGDGRAVHAYVIDTGIWIGHVEFGGRAQYGANFIGQSSASDCNGHGTHVAGTIGGARYGVAKKVQLIAVRVLDCRGSGDSESVAAGVNWVTEHAIQPAVANMSLGGEGKDPIIDAAVNRSIASGVTYTIAAGNDGRLAARYSPADVTAAITVGATDSRDRRASFSNYGPAVDLFAPGVGIWSAYSYRQKNTVIAELSGTSMAAPHVAGAAALVLGAHPAWTPAQVRNYLVNVSTTGRVTSRGAGSPNRLLFVTAPPAPPVVTSTAVPVAHAGTAYRYQFAVTKPRLGTWRLTSGTLPAGLTLSSSGLLAGTPAAAGSARVTVRFTDFVPNIASRPVTITVTPPAPVITTTALPDGTALSPYDVTLAADRAGTWALTGGVLPAGLTLGASTGDLSGTPAETGTFTVTVTVTDAWRRSGSRTYTFVIS